MEAAVMEISSSRWLVANVIDGFADHAIGTGTQIAWQAQLLTVGEALAREDRATAGPSSAASASRNASRSNRGIRRLRNTSVPSRSAGRLMPGSINGA